MDAEPPQCDNKQCGEKQNRDRRLAQQALWCASVGIAGGLAIAISATLGDISANQAMMLGLPAAILTFGGLIAAVVRDPELADRQGFRAGFIAGSLRKRWRSVSGRRRRGRL